MQGFFFDARYIRIDHHDGISRFSVGLLGALNKITPITAVICDLRQLDYLPTGIEFVKINPPTSALEPFAALKLNRLGARIVFSPMQTIGSFGRRFQLILTVHDLIYYRHPTPPPSFALPIRILWRLYHLVYWPQRLLLNRANAVATVSKTTANLIASNRLTKRPVAVVYNAPDHEPASNIDLHRNRPAGIQRLVYMGSFMDYKNVEVLVKAMAHLPDYELHLLSKISPNRKSELDSLVSNQAKVIFHNGVSDSQYHELVAGAVALVSGSRDEGFGIPLVEAMSVGTPIVVSDIPIFREIGGDAATYFNQEDHEAFVAAIQKIQTDANWSDKSQQGIVQAKKFNWENSAKSLLALLDQI